MLQIQLTCFARQVSTLNQHERARAYNTLQAISYEARCDGGTLEGLSLQDRFHSVQSMDGRILIAGMWDGHGPNGSMVSDALCFFWGGSDLDLWSRAVALGMILRGHVS